jgi:hypothetical protein
MPENVSDSFWKSCPHGNASHFYVISVGQGYLLRDIGVRGPSSLFYPLQELKDSVGMRRESKIKTTS